MKKILCFMLCLLLFPVLPCLGEEKLTVYPREEYSYRPKIRCA